MDFIGLFVRLILIATFAVAGVAKLSDIKRARKAIRDFGLPGWIANPLGIVLPLGELAIAGLLIPVATVFWGSVGAITLLLTFIIGISINLGLGRRPSCNCFGQVHSEPIGWPTLVRNGALVAGAGVVWWQQKRGSSLSIFQWEKGLSRIELAGVILGATEMATLAFGAWILFHFLRQSGRLLIRIDEMQAQIDSIGMAAALPSRGTAKGQPGLPIGSPAPHFELPELGTTSTISLDTLRALRRPILLVFSDPDCGPCLAMLPDIARWQREQTSKLTLVLISRGTQKVNLSKLGDLQVTSVLLQKNREIAEVYRVNGTPGAVLVGLDGRIASITAMGSQAITNLVAAGGWEKLLAAPAIVDGNAGPIAMPRSMPKELEIGHNAPSLKLPDLDGRSVDLAELRHETLVLFWNPDCGFCVRMLPDLQQWEKQRTFEAPQLLIVSTGTANANRAMGLRSTVVLDQTFATGQAFRVRGTPAGVLVDAQGKIASRVASGAADVLALANARDSQGNRDVQALYS